MLIYGIDVPEMNGTEFAMSLKDNPNAQVHFHNDKWDWYIIGANRDDMGQSVFCLISHQEDDNIKSFSQFPFGYIDRLNGDIDLDFKETPVFDLYLDCDELPDLYSQEFEENPVAYVHFIREARDGRIWHWHITEGRREDDGDYRLFGLVNGFDKELGYVMLSELAYIGAKVDLNFEKIGVMDIYDDFDLRR